MSRTRSALLAFGATASLAGALAIPTAAAAAPAASGTAASRTTNVQHLVYRGSANLRAIAAASKKASPSTPAGIGKNEADTRELPERRLTSAAPGVAAPHPSGVAVTGGQAGFTGFTGITHAEQRLANNGNQFSLEPPDQGLCAGMGEVFEQANTALAVYDQQGNIIVPTTALSSFFGVAPDIDRSHTPVTFGPFLSDPKCYFDSQLDRWFLTVLEIDTNPFTGAFGSRSATWVAVSQTADAAGTYGLFSIDATDDGTAGTPNHAGCPCLGDQPLIGADSNGFYISTNEFGLATSAFNGAQIYAVSKSQLAGAAAGANAMPAVVHIQTAMTKGTQSFSVQPAITPPGGTYASNREYFLSSTDAAGTYARNIGVWALANTSTLTRAQPNVHLTHALLPSELYVQPPAADQKAGPRPLGALLQEPRPMLNANDDRMQQVVYAQGRLFSALNTGIGGTTRPTGVGSAWFVVKPTFGTGGVGGTVVRQGYLSVKGQNLLFPAVALTAQGRGAMVFTLSGPGYYPSAAYAPFDLNGASGPVHLGGRGAEPEDGFTCYGAFGGNGVCRWGDYSAAAVDGSQILMATEYTPRIARTQLANWATFVGRLNR